MSIRKLSLASYRQLARFGGYSKYRRKSMRRGFPTKTPYLSKPMLVSCYGFRIEAGRLLIHLEAESFASIPLNTRTLKVLADSTLKVRSFTLTQISLSLCISKEIPEVEASGISSAMGIDRNLRNLTVGNQNMVTYYDMSKAAEIAENIRGIIKSFKRNDVRVRQRISSKYGRRRSERISQIIHRVTKEIVQNAKANKQIITFEDITGIRKLYRRGNGQGRSYRSKMNSWPFHEVKRQVEYKAAWEGVPVITLTRGETRGTTMDCPRCGERLQVPVRGDMQHHRQLWCVTCKKWRDRDLCAVLNISRRGWLRFDHSQKEGEAREAVKGNVEHEGNTLILRVDASKLRTVAGN